MKIAVSKATAALLEDDTLVENSTKLYIVEFEFDESWDGYTKTVIFQAGSVTVSAELTEDRYIIPSACLETPGVYLQIGVSGEKDGETKDTVWCVGSRVLYATKLDPGSVTCSCSGSGSVSADVMAQILEVITSETATDEEVEDVLSEVFEDGVDTGDGTSSNTATDDEVADMIDDVFG